MKRRAIRMLILFWLGWYLCGPVCETFDFWDPPRQEVHDVLFYAGGGITLIAAGFGFALALFRRLRARCSCPRPAGFPFKLQTISDRYDVLRFESTFSIPIHSPPVPLRI